MGTLPAFHDFENLGQTATDVFGHMALKSVDNNTYISIANFHRVVFNRISLARINAKNIKEAISNQQPVASPNDAYYLAKIQLEGECIVEQGGRHSHLYPGDFVVCSTDEPYRLYFSQQFNQVALVVPQNLLQELFSTPHDFLGFRMAMDIPTNALLSQFVTSLAAHIDQLQPEVLRHLEANVLDLLITSLQTHANLGQCRSTDKTVAQRISHIKRLVALHLRNPTLSPDFIAAVAGISTRYLHRLFEREGISISRYILQQRLAACHRALLNHNQYQRSIIDIALEWGFGDISHFHRCFKSRYGVTPRKLRMQGCDA
ncbi:MAG: helix-turn-helix domain-containing protein [Exilibacterium sp.]